MLSDHAGETVVIADAHSADRLQLSSELHDAADMRVVDTPSLAKLPGCEFMCPHWVIVAPPLDAVDAAIEQAHQLFGPVPVVVIGYLPAVMAFTAAQRGAEAFLPKPVSGHQLLPLLRPHSEKPARAPLKSLMRAEWEYLHFVLDQCQGNRSEAARRLGIHRSVLQRKLGRHPPAR